jgi:hypothetical protein
VAADENTERESVDEQGDDAAMMARLQEEIRNLPVAEHLVYMLHSLSALAAGRLGLTPDTAAIRDPGQARLAIDAFRALVGVLENMRPAGEMAIHRGMLSQLQLAYAGAMEQKAPAPGDAKDGDDSTEAAEAEESSSPPQDELPADAETPETATTSETTAAAGTSTGDVSEEPGQTPPGPKKSRRSGRSAS